MALDEQMFDDFCRLHRIGLLATSSNTDTDTFRVCGAFRTFFQDQCGMFQSALARQFRKRLEIHVNFCADPSLNAFAVRYMPGQHFIGINTGALGVLGHVFEQLFSKAPLLSKNLKLGPAQSTISREQIVTSVAYFAALHFLFAHELGHIAYGHTDLNSLQHPHGGIPLYELNAAASSGTSPELFQSMEIDADLHAATSVIAQGTRGVLCGNDMTQFLTSPTDIIKVTAIAILTMFHLFYGADVDIATYRAQTHPLPEVRLMKFWIRAMQMQSSLRGLSLTADTADEFLAKVLASVPPELMETFFPSLRLEGRVNMLDEAKRVRANEDQYEKQFSTFAHIPVGAVIA